MDKEGRMEAGGRGAQDGRREISDAFAQVERNALFLLPVLVCLDISIEQTHQERRFSSLPEVLRKTSLVFNFISFGVKESCSFRTSCRGFLYS